MFLCQPLLDVLIGRGIEDIDGFIQAPSWNDLPDPMSTPSMEKSVDRVLHAVKEGGRVAIHGDYDCDGVFGAHILRSVLASMGTRPRVYLPHRDEGYGLNSRAVHQFSMGGTDLLITVDNGINAQMAIRLCLLGQVVHRRRHAIGAVHPRHSAEFPQRILQALTQAGEAL